jgi:hypothetical protein
MPHGAKHSKQDEGGKQDDEKDDKEKKEEDQPKEPLLKRASDWSKAHPLAVLAIVAGVVALLVSGVFLWRYLESFESTDDAEVDGHINPIASRIAGTVVAVHVEKSQNVNPGISSRRTRSTRLPGLAGAIPGDPCPGVGRRGDAGSERSHHVHHRGDTDCERRPERGQRTGRRGIRGTDA